MGGGRARARSNAEFGGLGRPVTLRIHMVELRGIELEGQEPFDAVDEEVVPLTSSRRRLS